MSSGAAGPDGPVPLPPAVPPARAASVLADRMAAALVHREPGWRLPRRSALARRYNVSLTEIDAALSDLARRSLVRRLPDGQFYRASPADYWIPVEGVAGFGTRLDPMGGVIACQARHVSRREAPQDIAWALRLPAGAPVQVIRCVWGSAGDPVAVSTAYLHDGAAGPGDLGPGDLIGPGDPAAAADAGGSRDPGGPGEHWSGPFGSVTGDRPAAAVSVEMCPPQPSIARSLRLSPGQPVITVTIRFDDPATGEPAGLTVVMLKPELFRIAIDIAGAPVRTSLLRLPVRTGSPSGHARVAPGTLEPTCRPMS